MRALRPVDLDAFFAAPRVLILDYDGTLAPFVADRMRAVPYPGVREALGRIRGRVVIVSGRPVDEVRALLDLPLEMWGAHGLERLLPDGARGDRAVPAELLGALDRTEAALRALGDVERKIGSVAIHWRARPADADRIRGAAAGDPRLERLDFDGGIEWRVPGTTKADAVRAVLADSPGHLGACLGDDLTDEDAFLAVRGRGVSALVRPELRETAADLWLRPPGELLEFLNRWR